MKVPVFVMMIVDPDTGIAEPICVNKRRFVLEQGMQDTADSMTLSLQFCEGKDRKKMQAGIDSLHIVEGVLKVAG